MIGPVIIILTWASLCDWDSLGRADSERRAENNFSSIIIRQRGILRDRRRAEKRETILYSRVGRDWWYFYDISIPWIKNRQGFRIFGRFRFFSANCLTFSWQGSVRQRIIERLKHLYSDYSDRNSGARDGLVFILEIFNGCNSCRVCGWNHFSQFWWSKVGRLTEAWSRKERQSFVRGHQESVFRQFEG